MTTESIPQLSLGTAVLIIFVMCAGFVMLRGMTRMIVGTVVLALSTWAAFWVWEKAPAFSVGVFGSSLSLITTGTPIVTFLVSFFILRKFLKAVVHPAGNSQSEEKSSSSPIIRMVVRLMLALIPTTIICLIGATLIHHTGSIAELRAFAEKNLGSHQATPAMFSQHLKASVENTLPASWIRRLDPMTDPSRLSLAKVITAQSETPLQPVIDPRTGRPIPRAIIVDDPELQKLAREGKYGTLLRHPLLTKALDDPKLQALLKDLNL